MSEETIKPIEQVEQTEGLKPINDEVIKPTQQEEAIDLNNNAIELTSDNQIIEDMTEFVDDEEAIQQNSTPSHARIQPVVVSKLIDIYNRLRDDVGMISGFLSGHRAFDDVFDIFDLIVLSNVCFLFVYFFVIILSFIL